MTTNDSPDTTFGYPVPRGFGMRAEVRLFHTDEQLACQQDPDLFFDSETKREARMFCADCPFRGRCGYNAVAMGATHGVWGGINLPGDIPNRLRPVYARLAAQFDERRRVELGDVSVAPLPDDDEDDRPVSPQPASRRWPMITTCTA